MKNLLVCSCVADMANSKISLDIIKNHTADVLAGVEKKAKELDADIIYLLGDGEHVDGLNGEIRNSIYSPTLGNAYAVAQVLSGNLPRPMIQDDYLAVYEDKAVSVITAEQAYQLAKGTDNRFVAITKDGKTEVKEVAIGTSAAELVDATDAKAILVGDLKGKFVKPESLAAIKIDESLISGSIVVYGKDTCIVDTCVKLMNSAFESSCGKCVLCREGTSQFRQIVTEMTTGKAKMTDLDLIKEVSELISLGSYCPFGQNMTGPLTSAIELFYDEFEEHIKKKSCKCGVCYKAEAVYVIMPDLCVGCGDCIDECPEDAIEGKDKFIHMIDQDMCEQCGKCVGACDEEAIVAVTGKLPKLPKKLTKVGKF